jgi:hypothetical protein
VILESGLGTFLIRSPEAEKREREDREERHREELLQRHRELLDQREEDEPAGERAGGVGRQSSQDSGIGSNERLPRCGRPPSHPAPRQVGFAAEQEVHTYERPGDRRQSVNPARRSSVAGSFAGTRRSSTMFSGKAERWRPLLHSHTPPFPHPLYGRSGSVWSDEEVVTKRRKSIMMDSSLRGFQNMIDNTEDFMEKEIEELPVRLQE